MIFYCCRMQQQRSKWNNTNTKRTNLWSTQQTENMKKEELSDEDLSEEEVQNNIDDQELELFKKRMQSAPPRYQIIELNEDEDQSSSNDQLSQVEEQFEDQQEEDDTTRLSDESSIIQDYDQVPDDRPNIKPKSLEPFFFKKRQNRTNQS